jgi:hypothetical protein
MDCFKFLNESLFSELTEYLLILSKEKSVLLLILPKILLKIDSLFSYYLTSFWLKLDEIFELTCLVYDGFSTFALMINFC